MASTLVIAALLHLEFKTLFCGLLYICFVSVTIPITTIFAIFNINDSSWGLREQASTSGDGDDPAAQPCWRNFVSRRWTSMFRGRDPKRTLPPSQGRVYTLPRLKMVGPDVQTMRSSQELDSYIAKHFHARLRCALTEQEFLKVCAQNVVVEKTEPEEQEEAKETEEDQRNGRV